MQNNLQKYFPIIRERDAILAEIKSKENLLSIFENWSEEYQEEFLDICTGVRGVKILYDSFFQRNLKSGTCARTHESFFISSFRRKYKNYKSPA